MFTAILSPPLPLRDHAAEFELTVVYVLFQLALLVWTIVFTAILSPPLPLPVPNNVDISTPPDKILPVTLRLPFIVPPFANCCAIEPPPALISILRNTLAEYCCEISFISFNTSSLYALSVFSKDLELPFASVNICVTFSIVTFFVCSNSALCEVSSLINVTNSERRVSTVSNNSGWVSFAYSSSTISTIWLLIWYGNVILMSVTVWFTNSSSLWLSVFLALISSSSWLKFSSKVLLKSLTIWFTFSVKLSVIEFVIVSWNLFNLLSTFWSNKLTFLLNLSCADINISSKLTLTSSVRTLTVAWILLRASDLISFNEFSETCKFSEKTSVTYFCKEFFISNVKELV